MVAALIPAQYGYALGAATASLFVNLYHTLLTGKARKAAKIPYPITYASTELANKDQTAFRFNCAQRAHANFVENHISFLAGLFIASLNFSEASGYLGIGWVVARTLYAWGYTNYGPKGRYYGSVHMLFDYGIKILAVASIYKIFTT